MDFIRTYITLIFKQLQKGMFHTAKGGKLKAERRHFTPRKATYKIKRIQRTDLKTAW